MILRLSYKIPWTFWNLLIKIYILNRDKSVGHLEGIYSNLDYIIIILLLIFPGIILGLRLANNVKFFNKDDNLYYKRSQIIMIFWIISFLGRMLLFTLYPSNILAGFIIDLLLSFTLGLIIGESIILYSKYKQVLNPEPNINENL